MHLDQKRKSVSEVEILSSLQFGCKLFQFRKLDYGPSVVMFIQSLEAWDK
jgi:hypothetical protein